MTLEMRMSACTKPSFWNALSKEASTCPYHTAGPGSNLYTQPLGSTDSIKCTASLPDKDLQMYSSTEGAK